MGILLDSEGPISVKYLFNPLVMPFEILYIFVISIVFRLIVNIVFFFCLIFNLVLAMFLLCPLSLYIICFSSKSFHKFLEY